MISYNIYYVNKLFFKNITSLSLLVKIITDGVHTLADFFFVYYYVFVKNLFYIAT